MKLSVFRNAIAIAAFLVAIAVPAKAELIFGITSASSTSTASAINLVKFDSATPGTVTTVGALTGVVANQGVRSIDFKPGSSTLYAISTGTTDFTLAQIYTVNLATGALTPVGAGLTLAANGHPAVDMEFDPVAKNLRVVSRFGQNYRVNPTTGLLIPQDADLVFDAADSQAGTDPDVIAGAYSNSVVGALTTTYYGWDYGLDALVTVGNINQSPNTANTGNVFTVAGTSGPPFFTFNAGAGMDISGNSGFAYAVVDDGTAGTSQRLVKRVLSTGAVTVVGNFPVFVTDISVVPGVTAAGTMLTGRVFASRDGKGLYQCQVVITDNTGVSKSTVTGPRGTYSFDDLEGGRTYIVHVNSKQYRYDDRIVQVNDSVANFNMYPATE